MSATFLWLRSTLRRRWAATIGLALLVALVAGLVGASAQAARRASGAVDRHAAHSRSFDVVVLGCPPGFDIDNASPVDFERFCTGLDAARHMRDAVLAGLPEVESSAIVGTLVGGVLD